MSTLITSPPGVFVQGDVFDAQTKDQQGNPLTIKTGPNAGQTTQAWIINVAHSKTDPATLPYLLQLANLAKNDWNAFFPNGVQPTPPMFGCSHPKFAFKIMDGDGQDDNGKWNHLKPGMKGCWIVKYSTQLQAPKVFNRGEYDPMQQITDKRAIPKGSKVRVRVSVESNKNDTRPGMYLNPNMVEIFQVAVGADIIVAGEGADDAFGAGASTVAAGGSYAGISAAGGLIASPGIDLASYRSSGWTDDQLIAAGLATRAAPPPPAAPAPPPAPPAPPAAPAGIVPNPGIDLAAYRSSGWTDDQLVAAGHATRPAPAAASVPPPPSGATPPPPPPAPTHVASPPAPPAATPSPSNVAPYGGYMAGGAPPPPPGAVDTGGAPAGFTMTPAANGATYAVMLANNWTHEMMLQHGHMRPL